MGTVTSIADFLKRRDRAHYEAAHDKIQGEFLRAAFILPVPDFAVLSRQDHFGRETFNYRHVNRLLDTVRTQYPSYDLFPVELQAEQDIGRLITRYSDEAREGVSFGVLRREWSRAMEGLAVKLADVAAPIVIRSSSRSDVPNPRSA